ncbi:MAG: polysaccharide deacetylase family protein [Armatimonadota bacterium]
MKSYNIAIAVVSLVGLIVFTFTPAVTAADGRANAEAMLAEMQLSHLGPHLRSDCLSQVFGHLVAAPPRSLTRPLGEGTAGVLKGIEPRQEGILARRLFALGLRHAILRVAVASYNGRSVALIKLQAFSEGQSPSFSLNALQQDAVNALHTAFETIPSVDHVDLWAVIPANGSHTYEHLPVFSVSTDREEFEAAVQKPRRIPDILSRLGVVRVAPVLLAYAADGDSNGAGHPVTAFDVPALLDNWPEQLEAAKRHLRDSNGTPVKVVKEGAFTHRRLALTIDDGPHPFTTPLMLAVLREYGVKATFFLVGEKAEEYPELVCKIAADGHEIENHSYSHPRANTLTAEELAAEVEACQKIISRLTGTSTRFFRPPGGRMNQEGLKALAGTDHALVMWTNNANDWLEPPAHAIANSVTERATPGDIILMHQGSMESFRALPMILERLQGQGYSVGTVSDLMQAEGCGVEEMTPSEAMSYLTSNGFEHE